MMAMRQQRVAADKRPRQSSRTTYEDFEPHLELMEEHDAHIIHIQLPGFEKEQVRITFVHASGVIKVNGQRPLGNNIWSRFNQTFPLPQNSQESKIHGKFSSGLLTITIPKADPHKEAEAATKPTIQDAMLPKVDDPMAIPAAAAEPEAQTRPRSIGIEKTQEYKDNEAGFISPTTQNEKQSDVKRVISLSNTTSQPKFEANEKRREPNTNLDQVKKKSKHFGKEKAEKDSAAATQGNMKNVEKQVLVNVGVAMLVLVALGAYTTCLLWRPGKSKTN